jgi:capsular polysaccharide export protein
VGEVSFWRILEAAIGENPGAEIIVKTYPEVVSGHKKGYLAWLHDPRVELIACGANPQALIKLVDEV